MSQDSNFWDEPDNQHVYDNSSNVNPVSNELDSRNRPSFLRLTASFFLILILFLSLVFISLLFSDQFQDNLIALKSRFIAPYYPTLNSESLQDIEKRLAHVERRLKRMGPRKPYLIIDTSSNTFFVMKGDELLRQGVCSTGSYTLLKSADEKQQWIFRTPRGAFRVRNKATNPIWHLPDWAFVEAGRPIPPHGSPERVEYGVLGDYALHLGSGYLIHGTLYERYLGLPVTHGCIRVGDEDLNYLYKTLTFAARVFIY
jgi:L,D-transpeptidase ErfK/SrfK